MQSKSKTTFCISLGDRELSYLKERCDFNQMSASAMIAQALRVYQAVQTGAYIENPNREVFGCMGDRSWIKKQ